MSGAFGQAWGGGAAVPPAEEEGGGAQGDGGPGLEEEVDALELAALALLKPWEHERGHRYSQEELLRVVRWLDGKLHPAPPTRQRVVPFQGWKGMDRCCLYIGLCSFLWIFLLFIGLVTAGIIHGYQTAEIDPAGNLVPLGGGGIAAAGEAVHFHGIFDYPALPLEDLRRAEDVAFRSGGTFYLYRVAGVSKLMDGLVRILAADGTALRVDRDSISIERTFEAPRMVTWAEVDAGVDQASSGALRVLAHV